MNISLRPLTLADLESYRDYQLPHHSYHALNGPYYKKDTVEEVEKRMEIIKDDLKNGTKVLPNKRIISHPENAVIGEVSWYWKSQETNWMEIGIVIFDEQFWCQGIGYAAMRLWIDKLFTSHPKIVRLGISTWSGNQGMIKLAQKLGMVKEAVYRKARIVDGEYFDSISYGILREEWN